MPRPSFTSISRVGLGILFFAAPWVVGDQILQRMSPYWDNLEGLRFNLGRDLRDTVVAIGDCTIIPFRSLADKPPLEHMRVLGFGGSAVKEWYYLMKNNFEKMKTAKVVVIGVSPPARYTQISASYTSQMPFLMTWLDILEHSLVEKRIFFAETIRFLLSKQFESFSASQVMRYRAFDAILPNYQGWNSDRNNFVANADPTWRARSQDIHLDDDLDVSFDENDYFRRLAAISHAMNNRLVFMITPRSSWRAADPKYPEEVAHWLDLCKKLDVKCYNMSRVMPDSDFDRPPGDGLHLNSDKSLIEFWGKMEAELARTGKL